MPHSPGPWRWRGADLVNETSNVLLGLVAVTPDHPDARLIAAAPELLAVLRKVTARLRSAYEGAPADCVLEAEALLKRIDEGCDRG